MFINSPNNFYKLCSNYVEAKENSKNLKIKQLLKKNRRCGFEYIFNICYGRLLRIISNIKLINKHNILTDVAQDLDKYFISKYNNKLYLSSIFEDDFDLTKTYKYKDFKDKIRYSQLQLFDENKDLLIQNSDISIYTFIGDELVALFKKS